MQKLLLAFYGDDFTGSTDSMEALAFAGIRTVLFLSTPEPRHLQGRFAGIQALGIAGSSRSMDPTQMEAELRPKFEHLKQLAPPLVHYKVCSTFDSSPQIGSIGRAMEIGQSVFASSFVPLVVGAPVLRRYVAFGNLFATVDSETFRLDRHPTMSRHPITPMNESDLRRHLAHQTEKKISLFDLLHLAGTEAEIDARFSALVAQQPEIVLFDTVDEAHLAQIGRLLWPLAQQGTEPLFGAGSSGVEYALTGYWRRMGLLGAASPSPDAQPVDQIVVVSGSGAPVTAEQIAWATHHGFAAIRMESAALIDPMQAEAERERVVRSGLDALAQGQSVTIFSTQGPDDPAIAATRQRASQLGLIGNSAGQRLAAEQGKMLGTILRTTGIRRACIAGGDTCSHAAPQLGIYALEALTPLAPGGPLCRASSEQTAMDGIEIVLKGGQVGKADYFGKIRAGRA